MFAKQLTINQVIERNKTTEHPGTSRVLCELIGTTIRWFSLTEEQDAQGLLSKSVCEISALVLDVQTIVNGAILLHLAFKTEVEGLYLALNYPDSFPAGLKDADGAWVFCHKSQFSKIQSIIYNLEHASPLKFH